MTIVEINKKLYAFPTGWNDLTFRQLVQVLNLFQHCGNVYELNIRLLKVLTGMGWWRFLNCKPEQLAELLYLNEFLGRSNDLTAQLLPKYKGFYGPAADFENLVMCEFVFSEDAFFKWKESGDEQHLNALVAVLYRRPKAHYDHTVNADGDGRLPFNEYLAQYHAKQTVARWPLAVRRAIAFWYEGCRERLFADFPNVFGGSGGDPAKYGLLSIMRNVAEKGVHGKFADVERMHVRLVMVELDEMMDEVRRIKQSNG